MRPAYRYKIYFGLGDMIRPCLTHACYCRLSDVYRSNSEKAAKQEALKTCAKLKAESEAAVKAYVPPTDRL
jgi:hypothetical protein